MKTITRVKVVGWLNLIVFVILFFKISIDVLVGGVINFLVLGTFILSGINSYLNRLTKLDLAQNG